MIRVLFFGKIADLMGQRDLRYPDDGIALHALRDLIFADLLTAKAVTLRDIHMSLNQAKIQHDQALKDGDEVAFFSVFSGG